MPSTSRRNALRITVSAMAASASACSTSNITPTSASIPAVQPRVLVIGAGMSGLAAARPLHDHGYHVTVLEGRPRIGGRIWSSKAWPDITVDLGASWIHGAQGNPLTTLANEVGAQSVRTDLESSTLYSWRGGKAASGVEEAISAWSGRIDTALEDFAQSEAPDRSVRTVVTDALKLSELSPEEQSYINYTLSEAFEHEYAGSADSLSARYFASGQELHGDDLLFPGGYGQLTDHLAKGLTIILNETVQKISWSEQQVTVETSKNTYTAEQAIVTLPLGVLKSGTVTFEGELPASTRKAIETLGVGVLNKCFLEFPKVFWEDTDWLTYLPAPGHEGHWVEWINAYRPTRRPILIGFNAADVGARLEILSDVEIVSSAVAALTTMFGSHIPEPTRYQISRWSQDPFAVGSYSFIPAGVTPHMRSALAEPIADRIFFAGEATSIDYPATVRGAYETGRRAAQQIIDSPK